MCLGDKFFRREEDIDAIFYSVQRLLSDARDILCDWLDNRLGSTVTDNSIFASLPRHYEAEYHHDMDALNVRFLLNKLYNHTSLPDMD